MRWEKSSQLIALGRTLAGCSDGLTLDEMARSAGVDRRTAERMRDALRELFPQMEEVADGRSKRFRIPGGLDGFLQTPTADELAELAAAIRHLKQSGNDARAALLDALDSKIRSALRAKALRRLAPDLEALLAAEALAMQAGPRPYISADLLFHVREALKARRSLRFRYGEGMRHVDPWGLLLGRIPYLVGPKVGKSTPALWRLDRIDEVLLAEPDRGPPDDFDLKGYAARSFGAFQEAPEDVVLRFSPDAAVNARRFLFHPTQVFDEAPDGAVTVNFRAGGFLELVRHLFTWGSDVEILAPPRLRALMLEELRNALSTHERVTG